MSMPRRLFGLLAALVLAVASDPVSRGAYAQALEDEDEPAGHLTLDSPADLTRTEAIDFYASIADRMERGYAISQDPTAVHYRRWHRYNDAPYRSRTHGNRYVNNYANRVARRGGYGRLQPGDRLPAGSIIAKDSLTVTQLGARFPGALFIMEKLQTGKSPKTADWRYIQIMPDGSYFGDTLSPETGASMTFCHDCHKIRAKTDYLFFLPKRLLWSGPGE